MEPLHDPMLQSELAIGTVIDGRYTILHTLALGGMGVICLARHEALGMEVALKTVRRALANDAEVLDRFALEAESCARLRGAHVARVFDSGRLPDGRPYMVMELLEGEDVADKLARDRMLSCEEVRTILMQTCHALSEAHCAGLVHRDLKPENLFLSRDVAGALTVKVLDFGISKSMRRSGRTLTLVGRGLGSPRYMAPEQIETPESVDHRADIWALGVVAYEMLTGMTPFEGKGISEICTRVVRSNWTPLHVMRPDVWPDLERFVTRCMRRDVGERFQTMREALEALQAMVDPRVNMPLEEEPTQPLEIAGLRGRRAPAAFALALATMTIWIGYLNPAALVQYAQHVYLELPAMVPLALPSPREHEVHGALSYEHATADPDYVRDLGAAKRVSIIIRSDGHSGAIVRSDEPPY